MQMELSQQESGLHLRKGPNLEKHVSVLYYMKGSKESGKDTKSEVLRRRKINGWNYKADLSWEQRSQSE